MLIFNFHHVEDAITHPDRKHITITTDGLRQFIRTIRTLGLEIVSMRDVLAAGGLGEDNRRQVLLTFDDGYVNNYENALPVLFAEDCPATVFALPGRFGGTNEWDQGDLPEAERDRLMKLSHMRDMARSGVITFGSHGLMHRDLTTLSPDELHHELHASHTKLSRLLGDAYLPVFAYPWGQYSPEVLATMEHSPYQYAFTVETAAWQEEQPRFEIPRYSAYYRDGNPVVFIAKLARHQVLF